MLFCLMGAGHRLGPGVVVGLRWSPSGASSPGILPSAPVQLAPVVYGWPISCNSSGRGESVKSSSKGLRLGRAFPRNFAPSSTANDL